MKVVELLEVRRANWRQLEQLCVQMEGRRRKILGGAPTARFAALYRAACADLALADAYQLPSNTVAYLHQLVARAHNQLYRGRRFDIPGWSRELFQEVPRRLLRDKCLWTSAILFWGLFFGSFLYARYSPDFAVALAGKDMLEQERESFSKPLDRRSAEESAAAGGFYTYHNGSIGLECFAFGLLFGIGGLVTIAFNGLQLGAVFGYMSTVPEWNVFSQFVTAHGPFELTAIVFSGAAGMRLGFAIINTHGMSRIASLEKAGREVMPTVGATIAMFAIAALIESSLSPSAAPYAVKAAVAVASALLIAFYIVVLGWEPPAPMEEPAHAA